MSLFFVIAAVQTRYTIVYVTCMACNKHRFLANLSTSTWSRPLKCNCMSMSSAVLVLKW